MKVELRKPAANGDPVATTVRVFVDSHAVRAGRMVVRVVVADEANGDDESYEAKAIGNDEYEAQVKVTPGCSYTVVAVALLIDPSDGSVMDHGSDARLKCQA